MGARSLVFRPIKMNVKKRNDTAAWHFIFKGGKRQKKEDQVTGNLCLYRVGQGAGLVLFLKNNVSANLQFANT